MGLKSIVITDWNDWNKKTLDVILIKQFTCWANLAHQNSSQLYFLNLKVFSGIGGGSMST